MRTLSQICLVAVLLMSVARGERELGTVCQPLSLMGTELDASPLHDEPPMGAALVSRPYMFRSGIFEEVVAAITAPHHIAGADKDLPKESNLLVLMKASVKGDKKGITIDFSKVEKKNLERYGVSLHQLAKLTLHCIIKNLQVNTSIEEGRIPINWNLPEYGKDLAGKLKHKIIFKH